MVNNKKFENKSIRLRGYDYNLPGAYFITICLKNRKCLFGRIVKEEMILSDFGNIANECWLNIPNHFENTEVNTFVVMPNHVHGIIFIYESVNDINNNSGQRYIFDLQEDLKAQERKYSKLSVTISNYKAAVTREINKSLVNSGFKWQTSFHDHIIRNEKEMQNISDYIMLNPSMWDEDFENEEFRVVLTDDERKKILKELYKSFL